MSVGLALKLISTDAAEVASVDDRPAVGTVIGVVLRVLVGDVSLSVDSSA
jgi:hypothetical protein